MGFAQEVSAWLGDAAPPNEEILDAWTDIFSLKQGAQVFLARYRLKYTLWLMSDTDPAHFISAINRFPLLRNFDRYIVSYRQGLLKRDPGAFRELSEVVARGRRVVFVDDLEINIAAARANGIDGVLFESWEALGPTLKDLGVW
jgi:FMN phosphatase YigB (HAD superfamily)